MLSWSLYPCESGQNTKMWLNKNYSKVQRGECLADMSPIKNVLEQGDVFELSFGFWHQEGQANWEWLKLNGTHPLLVSSYNVSVLDESMYAYIL